MLQQRSGSADRLMYDCKETWRRIFSAAFFSPASLRARSLDARQYVQRRGNVFRADAGVRPQSHPKVGVPEDGGDPVEGDALPPGRRRRRVPDVMRPELSGNLCGSESRPPEDSPKGDQKERTDIGAPSTRTKTREAGSIRRIAPYDLGIRAGRRRLSPTPSFRHLSIASRVEAAVSGPPLRSSSSRSTDRDMVEAAGLIGLAAGASGRQRAHEDGRDDFSPAVPVVHARRVVQDELDGRRRVDPFGLQTEGPEHLGEDEADGPMTFASPSG